MVLVASGICFGLALVLKFADWMTPKQTDWGVDKWAGLLLAVAMGLIIYHYWPQISVFVKNF